MKTIFKIPDCLIMLEIYPKQTNPELRCINPQEVQHISFHVCNRSMLVHHTTAGTIAWGLKSVGQEKLVLRSEHCIWPSTSCSCLTVLVFRNKSTGHEKHWRKEIVCAHEALQGQCHILYYHIMCGDAPSREYSCALMSAWKHEDSM